MSAWAEAKLGTTVCLAALLIVPATERAPHHGNVLAHITAIRKLTESARGPGQGDGKRRRSHDPAKTVAADVADRSPAREGADEPAFEGGDISKPTENGDTVDGAFAT